MAFKVGTVNSDGTIAAGESNSLTEVATNAIVSPFRMFSTAAENELISKKEAGVHAGLWGAAGLIGGGMWARSRAAAGKEPIAGFLA